MGVENSCLGVPDPRHAVWSLTVLLISHAQQRALITKRACVRPHPYKSTTLIQWGSSVGMWRLHPFVVLSAEECQTGTSAVVISKNSNTILAVLNYDPWYTCCLFFRQALLLCWQFHWNRQQNNNACIYFLVLLRYDPMVYMLPFHQAGTAILLTTPMGSSVKHCYFAADSAR